MERKRDMWVPLKKKDEKQNEAKWKGERQNVSKERKILVLFFSYFLS